MSERMFRLLRADEIECRVQMVKENGFSLLLYKDARCDMNILDETVGAVNWQRKHSDHTGNLFCSVGIRNAESGEWTWKEDAGAPSNTEAQKGHASDSFKRACVNWGIGRELYTAPFIWITPNAGEIVKNRNGKPAVSSRLHLKVSNIEYDDTGSIKDITIIDNHGNVRYSSGDQASRRSKQADENRGERVSASQAEWVRSMCVSIFGMDKWQRMMWKSTGYQDPAEILVKDFADIKQRLEAREQA